MVVAKRLYREAESVKASASDKSVSGRVYKKSEFKEAGRRARIMESRMGKPTFNLPRLQGCNGRVRGESPPAHHLILQRIETSVSVHIVGDL